MKLLPKENPFIYDFKINNEDELPELLGVFKTIAKAKKFINDNFVAEHISDVAKRYYLDDEITEMRLTVNAELEDDRPLLEKEYLEASMEFEAAKTKKNDALEALNACITRAKNISDEIKSGWTQISIDPAFSFRIAINGKYYTYVYLDNNQLVLAKIIAIPEHEIKNLFNSVQKNEESIKLMMDEEVKKQKRPTK